MKVTVQMILDNAAGYSEHQVKNQIAKATIQIVGSADRKTCVSAFWVANYVLETLYGGGIIEPVVFNLIDAVTPFNKAESNIGLNDYACRVYGKKCTRSQLCVAAVSLYALTKDESVIVECNKKTDGGFGYGMCLHKGSDILYV